MPRLWFLLVIISAAGCASAPPVADLAAEPPVAPIREAAATRRVETRYEVRGYRDADDPSMRHEPHAVYRATRIPAGRGEGAALATIPRREFAAASYAPLPPSDELAAELAAQKQITAELRAIRAAIAATEQQAQAQFGTLVIQAAETVTLRRQLEQERARGQDLERQLREQQARTSAPVAAAGPAPGDAQPKW